MTTLMYLDQVLSGLPDNVSKLIEPVAIRNHVVSSKDGLGFMYTETQIAIPIVADEWVAINPLLVDTVVAAELWAFDSNNLALSNYAVLPATVPAGYSKVLQATTLMVLNKIGGGTDEYQFQYTRNGVGFGTIEPHYFAGTPSLVTLQSDTLADVSVADTYGVQVKGVGTGDSFDLLSFSFQLRDSWLLTDPAAP